MADLATGAVTTRNATLADDKGFKSFLSSMTEPREPVVKKATAADLRKIAALLGDKKGMAHGL